MPGPVPQALPTQSADLRAITVAIARQMLSSVGSGWQAPNGSNNAADALALAASFADLRAELFNVWAQAFVSSATSVNGLLSEWETLLAIPVNKTLSDADRQARLVAFMRSAIVGTPQDIESAVAAITGSCTVVEYSAADIAATEPSPTADTYRNVFRFTVQVPTAYVEDAALRSLVQSVVNRMKPAHTAFVVSDTATLKFDLPSGFDVTALGA